jgi:hypothetical protein
MWIGIISFTLGWRFLCDFQCFHFYLFRVVVLRVTLSYISRKEGQREAVLK